MSDPIKPATASTASIKRAYTMGILHGFHNLGMPLERVKKAAASVATQVSRRFDRWEEISRQLLS